MKKKYILFINIFLPLLIFGQHSPAREWNESLLHAIRNDLARPTIHARNLFHSSLLMYDSWAVFDSEAQTIFLGNNFANFDCPFDGILTPSDIEQARTEVLSYGMYRLLIHRFSNSPNSLSTLQYLDNLLETFGFDKNFTSIDYSSGSYAALGNYLASKIIEFGLLDNSNEQNGYANQFYIPENDPLILQLYEDNDLINPNKWQPLAFDVFIDQSGNIYPLSTPAFLSPEWGKVIPFSLHDDDLQILNNGFDSYVYHDPGHPVYIQNSNEDGFSDPYKWNFALVASWSSHLDPNDLTMTDISPQSLGNLDINSYPETFEEYQAFYDFFNGGTFNSGHSINPYTNQPYEPQIVKRADYTRVLAEFWADGPDSETPPGHWFTILNYVSDHPLLEKRIGGSGDIVSNFEWDVKSYLTLGGAMHDAAITTWGIKGYYDYIRPISAIRYMAYKGQSSDISQPSYNAQGLPLIPGRIELIEENDPLSGNSNENVGKIKIYSWKGPDYISNPDTDIAGVDWILGTQWWPYQRPTFVTPPFAGYLSGHSTFSSAAAEVLSLFTGNPFFPGGISNFVANRNEFLVFEEGPTEDIVLEWATYRDASDQTSLSRIWGGIHPPIDDIKGRIIGRQIGIDAFEKAIEYFDNTLSLSKIPKENFKVSPNPFNEYLSLNFDYLGRLNILIYSYEGKLVYDNKIIKTNKSTKIETTQLNTGFYIMKVLNEQNELIFVTKIIKK